MWGLIGLVRDRFGRWAIDREGIQIGSYSVRELREMLDEGKIDAHTWLRHVYSKRFSLVGEVLLYNSSASQEEFEAWFPLPKRQLADRYAP
ncbi:MAG: hypothetical protein HONBIEJF_00832 [Fimbriimonadaceae bacterium]|nr:hypothetical protein [Fimbriimonadaceae bacterium]